MAGRFTTRDSIGIWGDPINLGNGYTYAGNNPWTLLDPFGQGPYKWLYTGDWNADEQTYRAAVEGAAEWMYRRSPVRGGYAAVARSKNKGAFGGRAGASVSWTMDKGLVGAVGVGGGVGGRIRDPRTGQFQKGQAGVGVGVGYSEGEGWGWQGGVYAGGSQNGPKVKGGGVVTLTSEGVTVGIPYGPVSVGLILGLPPDLIDWLFEERDPNEAESKEGQKQKE